MMSFAATILVLVSPVLPEGPEQDGPTKVSTYILEGGKHYQGQVVAVEGDRVRFRVPVEGGSYDEWRNFDNFIPHCAFKIKKKVSDGSSAESHLDLARYASNNGLVYLALRELESARKIGVDGETANELEKEIEQRGAGILADMFHATLAKGDPGKARRILSELLIRYPETKASESVDSMLEELEAAEEKAERERLALMEKTRAVEEEKVRQTLLQPYRRLLEQGRVHNRDGLLSSKSLAKGLGHFEGAIRRYDSLIRRIEDRAGRDQNDETLIEALAGLRMSAISGLQDTLLNAGSMCLVRGQYPRALGYVNRVIALDPGNGDARAMRARIEIAANQNGFGL